MIANQSTILVYFEVTKRNPDSRCKGVDEKFWGAKYKKLPVRSLNCLSLYKYQTNI